MNPILSIVILTLEARAASFCRLLDLFWPVESIGAIELIVMHGKGTGGDERGPLRQVGIERAAAPFVCHFDDDDLPAPDYFDAMLPALTPDIDAAGFIMERRRQDNNNLMGWAVMAHGLGHDVIPAGPMTVWRRGITHLCPVRRELALQVGFKALSLEDVDFTRRLAPLLKKPRCAFIPRVLYTYRVKEPDKMLHERPRAMATMRG